MRTADVVVENFRPGVMARLGLAYDELKQLRPELSIVQFLALDKLGPSAHAQHTTKLFRFIWRHEHYRKAGG